MPAVTLPSGRVVRIRPAKPRALLALGQLPDELAELAVAMVYGQLTREQWIALFTLPDRIDQARARLETLRALCTAALVYPRLVEHPQADDEMHFDDLEDGDIIKIAVAAGVLPLAWRGVQRLS